MFQKLSKKMNNRKGFTLIELIVVIAILAILALIAVPRLAGFQEAARETSDEQMIAIIANAAAMAVARGDNTPTTAELSAAKLIKWATDGAVIADIKSAKYKAGPPTTLTYTVDPAAGTVTVTTSGGATTPLSATK